MSIFGFWILVVFPLCITGRVINYVVDIPLLFPGEQARNQLVTNAYQLLPAATDMVMVMHSQAPLEEQICQP